MFGRRRRIVVFSVDYFYFQQNSCCDDGSKEWLHLSCATRVEERKSGRSKSGIRSLCSLFNEPSLGNKKEDESRFEREQSERYLQHSTEGLPAREGLTLLLVGSKERKRETKSFLPFIRLVSLVEEKIKRMRKTRSLTSFRTLYCCFSNSNSNLNQN